MTTAGDIANDRAAEGEAPAAQFVRSLERCGVDPDLRQSDGAGYGADVEDSDWRFLVPLTPSSRILWLNSGCPISLAITAPHSLLVVPEIEAHAKALPATAAVRFEFFDLPFRDGCFDVVTAEVDEAGTGTRLAEFLREVARVLRPDGTLHVAVSGSARSQSPRLSWRAMGVMLRERVRESTVLRELDRAGFQQRRCYARLPSADRPRYMFLDGDRRALRFVLERLPTFAAAGTLIRIAARGLGGCTDFARLIAPGLFIVARLQGK